MFAKRALLIALLSALAMPPVLHSACMPFPDPDDAGCVPPDDATLSCSDDYAHAAGDLARRVMSCHIMKATRPVSFDEEACETEVEARYDKRVADQLPGCPPCMTNGAPALRALIEGFLEMANGTIYCEGTTPFGSDDGGFLPARKNNVFRCTTRMEKSLKKLASDIVKCHRTAAKDAERMVASDEEDCEVTARTKYDAAFAKLTRTVKNCPACLVTNEGPAANQMEAFLDSAVNSSVYCASPSGAFVDAGPG